MASEFTGVCVALFLPPSVAEKLALHGGERPEDLHITLGYYGDKQDLSDEQIELLRDTVSVLSMAFYAVKVRVSGVGMFSAPEGEKLPLYASVDSTSVHLLHDTLLHLNKINGPMPFQTYSFTPHITLDYVDREDIPALVAVSELTIVFDTITLAIGAKREYFPFLNYRS